MTTDDKLFDVKSLAGYLNVTPRAVRAWVHQRQIPFFKLGKLVRFRRAHIEAWLAERSVKVAK